MSLNNRTYPSSMWDPVRSFIDSIALDPAEFDKLESIDWYTDNDLNIELTMDPPIQTRNANSEVQDKTVYESRKRWPHQLMQTVSVKITDYRHVSAVANYDETSYPVYAFQINAKYCFDGATIPRLAWRLIGAPSDPRFIVGALIHDVLCQHHDYVDCDRKLASIVLERCCRVTGTGWITRQIIFWCTDLFQLLFRKW